MSTHTLIRDNELLAVLCANATLPGATVFVTLDHLVYRLVPEVAYGSVYKCVGESSNRAIQHLVAEGCACRATWPVSAIDIDVYVLTDGAWPEWAELVRVQAQLAHSSP